MENYSIEYDPSQMKCVERIVTPLNITLQAATGANAVTYPGSDKPESAVNGATGVRFNSQKDRDHERCRIMSYTRRINSYEDLEFYCDEERKGLALIGMPCRIVMINGCFDGLHYGHFDFIKRARSFGDKLIIALNSDSSIKELKGDTRPYNCQERRIEMLLELRSVCNVFVFDEPTSVKAIRAIKPDFWVKSKGYAIDKVDEEEYNALTECGATMVFTPPVPGLNATDIGKKKE